MQKYFLAVIGLSCGLDLKRSGTELTIANQMDLGNELRRRCCRIFEGFRSSDIPLYQCFGERTIKKQNRRKDINTLQRKYGKYRVAPPDGHLLQSAQSLRSGAVADMIAELPVGRRAPEKPVASGQLDKQEILTQPALAELQATEE